MQSHASRGLLIVPACDEVGPGRIEGPFGTRPQASTVGGASIARTHHGNRGHLANVVDWQALPDTYWNDILSMQLQAFAAPLVLHIVYHPPRQGVHGKTDNDSRRDRPKSAALGGITITDYQSGMWSTLTRPSAQFSAS